MGPSTLSVALAEYVTGAPAGLEVFTLKSTGTVRSGAVVSTSVTVTSKLPLLEFPCASVAVHPTVVLPTENVLPDAGEQTGVTDPCGGVVSCTTTSADAGTTVPSSVVVVHVTVVDGGTSGKLVVTENEPTPAVPSG